MPSPAFECVFWYFCFFAGLILFLAGILFLLKKRSITQGHLVTASLFEFAASIFLYLPEEYFNDIPESAPVLHAAESFFTAVLRTFNIYQGNDYSRISFDGHPVFSGFYATLITLTNIVMLLCVIGVIIKFLEGPAQRLRLALGKKKNVFLFPVCNEKTLAIAESIDRSAGTAIFTCSGEDLTPEDKERLAAIDAIYVDSAVDEIFRSLLKNTERLETFLFEDSEERNLAHLEDLCSALEGRPIDDRIIRIYVELSQTPWSLYDGFLRRHGLPDDKDSLVVNFVRTEENFAYNNLLKHSIFRDAVPDTENGKEIRRIGVLLLGMNERNLEMFKAVLHLSQMPGYRLTVLVMDKPNSWEDHWEELLQKIPELHKDSQEGDALYKIHYFDNVDFAAGKLEEYVPEYLPDFNFAFVNVGDDLLNLNLALRLQALCVRCGRKDGYHIQVNIKDEAVCRYWNPDLLTERIELVGSTAMTCDYDFITMSDIERATIAIHKVRYPADRPDSPSWVSYCNSEYNRHSVYARTLSFKYKVELIDEFYRSDYTITSTDRTWKIYEHMRWNVYTRTLGYVLADSALLDADGNLSKQMRTIAKVHNDLIPYDDLSEEEQNKDALKLTGEIVKILKEI